MAKTAKKAAKKPVVKKAAKPAAKKPAPKPVPARKLAPAAKKPAPPPPAKGQPPAVPGDRWDPSAAGQPAAAVKVPYGDPSEWDLTLPAIPLSRRWRVNLRRQAFEASFISQPSGSMAIRPVPGSTAGRRRASGRPS